LIVNSLQSRCDMCRGNVHNESELKTGCGPCISTLRVSEFFHLYVELSHSLVIPQFHTYLFSDSSLAFLTLQRLLQLRASLCGCKLENPIPE
jgi:hypothetical protein